MSYVAEVDLDFPRQWIEFQDPDDEDQIYRCDLTWLTSSYNCIYGRGCQGIYATSPNAGCCSLGAHFADKADLKKTRKMVKELDESIWQNLKEGLANGWTEKEDGELKTRVYKGACIFSNRAGFEGGMGCAFHLLAERQGVSHVETKPEVCWQLPLKRDFDEREREDDTSVMVISIGEYDRRGWGAGGHDLDWYCTGNPEAHNASEPLYKTSKDELVALMSPKAYDILVEFCEARMATLEAARKMARKTSSAAQASGATPRKVRKAVDVVIRPFAPHPADPLP